MADSFSFVFLEGLSGSLEYILRLFQRPSAAQSLRIAESLYRSFSCVFHLVFQGLSRPSQNCATLCDPQRLYRNQDSCLSERKNHSRFSDSLSSL